MADLSAEFESWWSASLPHWARPSPQSAAICVAFGEHVAALSAQPPAPAAASDGERANVAEALMDEALWFEKGGRTSETMRRAATLLRHPAPAQAAVPVPVDERPWERDGWCDAQGRCWMGDPGGAGFIPSWRFCRPEDAPSMNVSLPHWAIPIPQPPKGGEVADA